MFEGELLAAGWRLAGAGLGVVFAFLTLLVLATTLMSRLVIALSPPASPAGDDPERIKAVLQAAVDRHLGRG